MHTKLKVGMSSLHSKIGAANSNMPQAPKPVVRKFADGGAVRTRSDEEIGDTDPRTGKVDPGSYDRRMAEGAKNMERLRSAADSIKSFFSSKESPTSAPTSASNITGDTGMSAADEAKKAAMSGSFQMPKAEEKRREMTDYMVKPTETESKTEIKATPVETGPAPAPTPAPAAKKVVVKKNKASQQQNANVQKSSAPAPKVEAPAPSPASKVSAPSPQVETKAQMREKELRASGGSRGARTKEAVTDTGDETKRLRDRTSKSIPGVVGRFDLNGNQIPVGLGPRSSRVYGGDGSSVMSRAEKNYLQSRIDAGNLTAMEKAQAKRAGLI